MKIMVKQQILIILMFHLAFNMFILQVAIICFYTEITFKEFKSLNYVINFSF